MEKKGEKRGEMGKRNEPIITTEFDTSRERERERECVCVCVSVYECVRER
jgi:hypothetical protein